MKIVMADIRSRPVQLIKPNKVACHALAFCTFCLCALSICCIKCHHKIKNTLGYPISKQLKTSGLRAYPRNSHLFLHTAEINSDNSKIQQKQRRRAHEKWKLQEWRTDWTFSIGDLTMTNKFFKHSLPPNFHLCSVKVADPTSWFLSGRMCWTIFSSWCAQVSSATYEELFYLAWIFDDSLDTGLWAQLEARSSNEEWDHTSWLSPRLAGAAAPVLSRGVGFEGSQRCFDAKGAQNRWGLDIG